MTLLASVEAVQHVQLIDNNGVTFNAFPLNPTTIGLSTQDGLVAGAAGKFLDVLTGSGGAADGATSGGDGGRLQVVAGGGGVGSATQDPGEGGPLHLFGGSAGADGGTGADRAGGPVLLRPGARVNNGDDGQVILDRIAAARAPELVFKADNDSSIGFKAPADFDGGVNPITYIWPDASPTAGQMLTAAAPAGGISVLSWGMAPGTSFQTTFVDNASDTYVINHALGSQYVNVTLWDNNDELSIGWDSVVATDANNLTLDLTSIRAVSPGGTLPGTWKIRVSA